MTSDHIKALAYEALPYLIRCAQKQQTVTYGELGKYLHRHHHTLSHFLGFIRDQICDPQGYPSLTALVVSKYTHRPSDGFFKEGVNGFSEDEKQQKFEQYCDDIFSFQGWDGLLGQLGLNPLPATDQDLDREAEEYNRLIARTGGESGGEQDQHRLLKEYIAIQPHR